MPEDSKKNMHKGAKDQRKPRNRHQAGPTDKRIEKKSDEPKVPVQKPPVYEDPGPEFYKNLKRETDEILKITEEANSKYKKKEIQSNWSKYEMPIESYDEIEEQENMGADYEKLIEAPLSVGGHFQFKHEKSWDVDTAPSLYDKYFEVNMDNLFLSIATIPFHERLNVNKSIFSETDILTMNNRATRFKQKYYNNKAFTTPELTVQDSILSSLKENLEKPEESDDNDRPLEDQQEPVLTKETSTEEIKDISECINDIKLENDTNTKVNIATDSKISFHEEPMKIAAHRSTKKPLDDLDNFEDLILEKDKISQEIIIEKELLSEPNVKELDKVADQSKQKEPDTQNNPIIESPEDLEKWLDDFLDG